MGLFDFLKRAEKPADAPEDDKVGALGMKAADKRSQTYDRDEAIRKLIDIGTHEAAQVMLKRFKFTVDPSITDQDEKQLVFDGIVSIGKGERGRRVSDANKDPKVISDAPLSAEEISELREAVVNAIHDYCKRAENLTWPLRIMRALLDDENHEQELLRLLGEFDTEYTRNVEPKLNILAAMEGVPSDAVREAAEEYLDDVHETVRFHAVQTTFEQANMTSLSHLVSMMGREESVRVKNKVCDGIIAADWPIPSDMLDSLRNAMSDVHEYALSGDGRVTKLG